MDGELLQEDNLGSLVYDLIKSVNIKVAMLIFILYLFINTTIYAERILGKWSSKFVSFGALTESGIVASGVLLTICYIVFDLLVQSGAI